jgi:PAS domain S-box-containing protein
MTRSSPSSIKRKVTIVILRASIAVLLVTVAAFMVYDIVTFRQTMVQNLLTQARTLADNCTGDLAFRSETDAASDLASLQTSPHITAAAIYDAAGRLFAKYPGTIPDASLPASPQAESYQFKPSRLTVFQPIVQSGRPLGTLYLQSDVAAFTQRLQVYGVISLLITAVVLLVAFWLSTTLQQRITNPIIALAKTARGISLQRNFSVRAEKMSDDELGDLTDAFNSMLDQLQSSHADLEKGRMQLQIVTDYASVFLCHVDRAQIFQFVNPAFAARFHLAPDQVMGRCFRDVVGPQAYAALRPYVERAIAGERVEFELEVPYEALGARWMHTIYVPERDRAGKVVGFVGVISEITERKRQEMELAKLMQQTDTQARLFDAILSSISDLAYYFDLEGNWIYANKPLLQLWGKSLAEITGKSSWQLGYPPELAERLRDQVLQVVRTRKPVRGETTFTSAAGVEDYHEYIFSPVLAADGRVTAVCGTTRLTTERKRAEQELERARDQAMAASRAKDNFLAALSHELRTPLNPVLLIASDAAHDPQLPSRARADFEMIRRNVELEARLIDDLLDLTRIVSGKLLLEKRPLDVRAVLQDALAIVRLDAETKKIDLTLDLGTGPSVILGDPLRLQQIFWNVLKNAVKFTPAGGRINVELRAPSAGGNVAIKIVDTGLGLTGGEITHIFDAFAQGDHAAGSSSHQFGGLGLGLAISRMLVKLHSGDIQAASAGRHQGSTFTIELPCLSADQMKALAPPPLPLASQPASAAMNPPPRRRILLVEDHEPTRAVLARLLTRRDYQVLTATSAAEALTLAREKTFDLVVSDIGLPDGNGYALMAELRDQFGLKGIALTGYGMEEDVSRAQNSGFIAHLTKPVRIEALEKALHHAQ